MLKLTTLTKRLLGTVACFGGLPIPLNWLFHAWFDVLIWTGMEDRAALVANFFFAVVVVLTIAIALLKWWQPIIEGEATS